VSFAGCLGPGRFPSAARAPRITAGTELEAETLPDLGQILAKLDAAAGSVGNITNIFGGDNFQNLLGPFTDFLKENSPRLTAILGNIQVISKQIADGEGTIGKLVSDDALYVSALSTVTNMSSTATDIQALATDAQQIVAEAKQIMSDVNAGRGRWASCCGTSSCTVRPRRR
jgi:phospholipid/cholesterol/gamma-HCH transport system substrate-binding protein